MKLGWGFWIRTDSVEGQIRVDSEQSATEMDSEFGRIQSRVGLGWIQVNSWTPEIGIRQPSCEVDTRVFMRVNDMAGSIWPATPPPGGPFARRVPTAQWRTTAWTHCSGEVVIEGKV